MKKLDKNLHLTEEKNQALAKICISGIGNSGECLWAPALLNTVSETASAIKNMFHSNESWLNYQRWLKIALYILTVNINYCRFLFFFLHENIKSQASNFCNNLSYSSQKINKNKNLKSAKSASQIFSQILTLHFKQGIHSIIYSQWSTL